MKTFLLQFMMTIPALVIHLSPFAGPTLSSTDSIAFDVFRSGKKIGTIRIQNRQTDNAQNIRLNSDMKGKFIFEINVQATIDNNLLNDRLVVSRSVKMINGNVHENQQVQWKNGSYYVSGKEEEAIQLPETIGFTSAMLYLKEPLSVSRVFSESLCMMVPVSNLSAGVYRLNLPDGKYSDYHYKDGRLSRVIAKTKFGEILLVKNK